jgi:hypothetical protein
MKTVVTVLGSILLLASCDTGVSPRPPARGDGVNAAQSAGGGPFGFVTFELGATPGTVCPGSGGGCTNGAAEPQIRADATGSFYVSSELGLSAGTLAWKSTDGGQTWSKNVLSATIPGDDREWIAADQATKVCVSYHDIVTFNIDVNCSFDAGASFTQLGSAIDVAHAFLLEENEIGNLTIDPSNHVVYQAFSGIANASEAVLPAAFHAVWIAVSRDGGQTFTDYAVYVNPDITVSYGHQFVNVSVDRAGTVYVVYSDNHNLFYSFSTDHAETWTGPVQVNQAPSATAIMPWSVACAPGELDVVWYGTSYYDGASVPDNYTRRSRRRRRGGASVRVPERYLLQV